MSTQVKLPTPEQAFELYKSLVEDEDIDQAMTVMLYCGERESAVMGIEIPESGGARAVLPQVLRIAKEKLGDAQWIMFSSESWVRTIPRDEYETEYDKLPPMDLNQEAREGHPDIRECVVIVGVDAETAWQHMRMFKRENGEVVWDEETIKGEEDSPSGIVRMLFEAVRG